MQNAGVQFLTSSSEHRWTLGRELAVVVLLALLSLTGCASLQEQMEASQQDQAEPPDLEAVYGIRVEGLRLSAAGAMLDFRYRVLDAKKAAVILDGKTQPYLLDEVRGAKLGVPDTPILGRIRQTARNNNILVDRTYFIMFGNPGHALVSGDKVTLLLGQRKVTDLTVQ